MSWQEWMAEAPTATMAVPRGSAAKQLNSNLKNKTIASKLNTGFSQKCFTRKK
jgi:hypothetical protein